MTQSNNNKFLIVALLVIGSLLVIMFRSSTQYQHRILTLSQQCDSLKYELRLKGDTLATAVKAVDILKEERDFQEQRAERFAKLVSRK